MNRMYFFFDIDGTLTDIRDNTIPESARRALDGLRAAGHFVCAATGRANYKAHKIMDQLDMDYGVVAGGGGLLVKGVLGDYVPLDPERVKIILEKCDEFGIGYILTRDDSEKVYMKDRLFIDQAGERREETTYVYEPDMGYEPGPVFKIYLPLNDDTMAKMKPYFGELGCLLMAGGYYVLEIDRKREGILRMLEKVGGTPENTVVFGDGVNDLDMFTGPWFSIAMGNAPEELRERADYVTNPSYEDGIWNACRHFGWIDDEQPME